MQHESLVFLSDIAKRVIRLSDETIPQSFNRSTDKLWSSRKFANMTFANRTFANGESHVDIRQWRKSCGHSPIYPPDIRQLAKVRWIFASIPAGHSPIGESHMDVRQYWRNSTTFSIIKTGYWYMRWILANLPNTQQVLIHIRVIQRLPIIYVLSRYFVD